MCQALFYSLSMYQLISSSPQVYEEGTIIMPISQVRKWSPSKVRANLHPKLTLYYPALKHPSNINLQVDHPSWFFFLTRLKLLSDLHHTSISSPRPVALSMKQIIHMLSQEPSVVPHCLQGEKNDLAFCWEL